MKSETASFLDISSRLGTFRPSDRQEIARALRDPARREEVSRALKQFVERWENASWLEDYSIERIGKWFAISAEQSFVVELKRWSRVRRTKARKALLEGLAKGGSMSPQDRSLATRELENL